MTRTITQRLIGAVCIVVLVASGCGGGSSSPPAPADAQRKSAPSDGGPFDAGVLIQKDAAVAAVPLGFGGAPASAQGGPRYYAGNPITITGTTISLTPCLTTGHAYVWGGVTFDCTDIVTATEFTTSISGTTNTVAKFTGPNAVGDSTITDSAGVVATTSRLSVTNSATGVSGLILLTSNAQNDGITADLTAVGSTQGGIDAVRGRFQGTIDTTTNAITADGGLFTAQTTRSAGAFDLTNQGAQGLATGGQLNVGLRGDATGNATDNTGLRSNVSGTTTISRGLYVTNTGVATTAYGTHILLTNTGTTSYGMYSDVTGAGTNYAYYGAAGLFHNVAAGTFGSTLGVASTITAATGAGTPTAAQYAGTEEITALSASQSVILGITNSSAGATNAPNFIGRRARNTLASPQAVQADDRILAIVGGAYDGTVSRNSAAITFWAEGTITNNVQAPQRIAFETGTTGTRTTWTTLSSVGLLNHIGSMTIGDAVADNLNISATTVISGNYSTGNALTVRDTDGDAYIRFDGGGGTNQAFLRMNDTGQYLAFSVGTATDNDCQMGTTGVLNCVGGLQVNGTNVVTTASVVGTTNRLAKFTGTNAVGNTAFPIDDTATTLTIGDSTANDATTISGSVAQTYTGAANALTVTYSGAAQTADRTTANVVNSGSFNTTGSSIASYGLIVSNSATVSAGSNLLHTYGVYSTAGVATNTGGVSVGVRGIGTSGASNQGQGGNFSSSGPGVDIGVLANGPDYNFFGENTTGLIYNAGSLQIDGSSTTLGSANTHGTRVNGSLALNAAPASGNPEVLVLPANGGTASALTLQSGDGDQFVFNSTNTTDTITSTNNLTITPTAGAVIVSGQLGVGATPAATIVVDVRDATTKDAMLLYHTGGNGTYTASADFFAVRNDDTTTAYNLLNVAVANDDSKRLKFTSAGVLSAPTITENGSPVLSGTISNNTYAKGTAGGNLQDGSLIDDGTTVSTTENAWLAKNTTNSITIGYVNSNTTNGQNNITLIPDSAGDSYLETKVATGKSFIHTIGAGTNPAYTLTWLTVSGATAGATFGTSVNVNDNFTAGNSTSADSHTINGPVTHSASGAGSGGYTYNVSYTASATTADRGVININNAGTYDATAAQRVAYGIVSQLTATRSAGANNLVSFAGYFSSTGAQDNRALYTFDGNNHFNAGSGASTFYGNVTIGDSSSLDSHIIYGPWQQAVTGAGISGNAILSAYSGTAVAGDRNVARFTNNGTYDATAAGRTAYAMIAESIATRSAGANNVNNYAGYFNASGGQVNFAIATFDGEVALNSNSGNTCIGSTGCGNKLDVTGGARITTTLQVNGNTTLGDAATDAVTVNGLITGTSPVTNGTAASYRFGGAGGGVGAITYAGNADNNGAAYLMHNAYAAYNTGGSATWKWTASHASFGSRGISFDYASATPGIVFYADNAASTADSSFTPTARFYISNTGPVRSLGETIVAGGTIADTTNGIHLGFSSNVGTISAQQPGTAYRTLNVEGAALNLNISGTTAVAINSSNQVLMGDTGSSSIGSNLGVLIVGNTGTGQTTSSLADIDAANTGSYNTTSGNVTHYVANFDTSATESAGGNTFTNVALRLDATGGDEPRALQTVAGEVALNTTSGNTCVGTSNCTITASSYKLYVNGSEQITGSLFMADSGGTLTIDASGAGQARFTMSNAETSLTQTNLASISWTGSIDATAATQRVSGLYVSVNGSQSAGANSAIQYAVNADASPNTGMDESYAFHNGLGDNYFNDNASPGITIFGNKIRALGTAPSLSSCGTSPTVTGSDLAGVVTIGTGSATACTVTFASSYFAEPSCTLGQQSATGTTWYFSAKSATAFTVTTTTGASIVGLKFNYHCIKM